MSNKTPLSEQLRKAELIFNLQLELDDTLRKGYVALSGVRATARPGVLLLSPITWPTKEKAEVFVSENMELVTNENISLDEQEDKRLRDWCGGFKPSPEVFQAQSQFREVIRIALNILKTRDME